MSREIRRHSAKSLLRVHFSIYQRIQCFRLFISRWENCGILRFLVEFSELGFLSLKFFVSWNHRMVNLVIHGILDEFALRVRYVGDYAKPKHRRSTNFE